MSLCECGCGQPTKIAKCTDRRAGNTKGQPQRFMLGHNGRRPLIERFWAKVDQSGGPDACWPWTGKLNSDGYGRVWVEGGEEFAHRVAWRLAFGPTNLNVLHSCDNPPCCNLAHLFDGTQADNMADMHAKGRANQAGLALGRGRYRIYGETK